MKNIPDKIYVDVTDLGFVSRAALCNQGGSYEFFSRDAVERIIRSSTSKEDAFVKLYSLKDHIPIP